MKVFFRIRFQTSVLNFIKIGIASVRARADRHTDRHRGDLIIFPMLCYSNGTDNKKLLGELHEKFNSNVIL